MLKVVGASWIKIQMSTWIIGMVLVLGIIVIILGQMGQIAEDGNYSATVNWNKETGFEIRFWGQGMRISKIPKGVARVYYQTQIDTLGWAIIDIETQANYPDWVQAYAAGMLEGSLSWQLIYWHWKNTVQHTCETRKSFCHYVKTYLEENLRYVREEYEAREEDPYWHQLRLFYFQLEGLKQGFEHGVKRSRQQIEHLDFVDFIWLNAASDVIDLEYRFHDSKIPSESRNLSKNENHLSDSVLWKKIRSVDGYPNERSRININDERAIIACRITLGSSLVKFLPEKGQLLVAQNAAGPYSSMLKMIKHYHFRYHWSRNNPGEIQKKLTFSSYPGAIHSVDDFYVISMEKKYAEMIITGTPITVFNRDLWTYVSSSGQVLSGPRTIVASRLSQNPSDWLKYLSKYNSGTGNKQWMVIDVEELNQLTQFKTESEEIFQEKMTEAKNILWVAEQLPGHFEMSDQTQNFLNKTYWAIYGLPYFNNISKISGVNQIQEIHGDMFSYENSPLARVYRKDHHKAQSADTTMELMRTDLCVMNPLSVVSSKCSSVRDNGTIKKMYSLPMGVIDSKVYSVGGKFNCNETAALDTTPLERSGAGDKEIFQAVAGPPQTSEGKHTDKNVEPFSWSSGVFTEYPHHGHPDVWNFRPVCLSV